MRNNFQFSIFNFQNRIKRKIQTQKRGDTLIEVIFAFAILGTIIGFAYGGAIQARKSAIAAQQRTQAAELVQKQTAAVKAYRDSLPWDNTGGSTPSFLNGNSAVGPAHLPDLTSSASHNSAFCMLAVDNAGKKQWSMLSTGEISLNNYSKCFTNITPGPVISGQQTLQADNSQFCVQVLFSALNSTLISTNINTNITQPASHVNCPQGSNANSASPIIGPAGPGLPTDTVQADIAVYWDDPFGQQQSVKNIVILTKQR